MAPSTSLEPNALIADMWEKCQDAIDFKAVRAEGDVLGLWSNDAAVDDMKKALRKFKQLLDAQPPAPESSVGIEAVDLVKTEEGECIGKKRSSQLIAQRNRRVIHVADRTN